MVVVEVAAVDYNYNNDGDDGCNMDRCGGGGCKVAFRQSSGASPITVDRCARIRFRFFFGSSGGGEQATAKSSCGCRHNCCG